MSHDIPHEWLRIPDEDLSHIDEALRQPLIDTLSEQVTPERYAKMQAVLAQRTRHITLALENISKPHNASAILRSCDTFGVQDLHIIDDRDQYTIKSTAASGAYQWVTQHFYDETDDNLEECFTKLREKGYTIVGTTLREDATPLHALPIDKPLALIFGTELHGMTDEAHAQADMLTQVPMVGFTDSLNISVAAAISLHNLTDRVRRSDLAWQLSATEQRDLLLQWLLNTIPHSDAHTNRFLSELNN